MSRRHVKLDAGRWAATRRAVFERDGWRCTSCGRAGRLECDHIVPLHVDPHQEPFDPKGCQTLCRCCHIEKTRWENRRPLTPEEQAWRDMVAEMMNKSG